MKLRGRGFAMMTAMNTARIATRPAPVMTATRSGFTRPARILRRRCGQICIISGAALGLTWTVGSRGLGIVSRSS